ncbi:MAG: helix-turn-helix transcriptional regulator [Coxiellaceae bacterium]|nr:helix-turn-helix transcriptional regulator [Coxiellaceae bacterium]
MSDLDQEIGKRLRKARKLRGYKSARSFAIERKIPESTYSQHETGKRSLSPEIVLRYCECLGIDPGWLLSGREAEMSFSGETGSVAEVSLNTSHRHMGHQNKDASTMVTENLVTVDMDIFKGALKQAIQKINAELSDNEVEALITSCLQAYYGIAKSSSDYSMTESDTRTSA